MNITVIARLGLCLYVVILLSVVWLGQYAKAGRLADHSCYTGLDESSTDMNCYNAQLTGVLSGSRIRACGGAGRQHTWGSGAQNFKREFWKKH